MKLTLEDIKALKDFVSLGATYAEDSVVSGVKDWQPLNEDRMRELCTSEYGRIIELLNKLEEESSDDTEQG